MALPPDPGPPYRRPWYGGYYGPGGILVAIVVIILILFLLGVL